MPGEFVTARRNSHIHFFVGRPTKWGCNVKRFIGWGLTLAGGTATLWGGTCVITGTSESRMHFTPDLSLNALTVGLAGLAVLTIGLIWVRD
jgi:hypothetical protein